MLLQEVVRECGLVLKPQDDCERWWGRAGRGAEEVLSQQKQWGTSLTKGEWEDVY